jgi:hypothetical protein
MTGIEATVAGLATALRYVCHILGVDAALDFLEAIRDQFGPLAEGAVIAEFTASAFERSMP